MLDYLQNHNFPFIMHGGNIYLPVLRINNWGYQTNVFSKISILNCERSVINGYELDEKYSICGMSRTFRPHVQIITAANHAPRRVECVWNLMAHGDTREGKWRGNWWMEWVAGTHTTSERGVSSITYADAHTSAASSRLNWRSRRFKWTHPFRRKTKSSFCACAIAFQTRSIKTAYPTKAAGHSPASSCQVHRKPWQHHCRRDESKAGTGVRKGARGPSMLHMFFVFSVVSLHWRTNLNFLFCTWMKIRELL